MADTTLIAWTSKTRNPWRGCSKISPGCKNCYMFPGQTRYGRDPREVVRTTTWAAPLRWQRQAEEAGRSEMVSTCSWSDWFHADADEWRDEAWALVKRCPNLVFQILTKRSKRIVDHLPNDWGSGYRNVWLGVSIENDEYLWRADDLREIPAAIRFVSAEPLLGPLPSLDLTGIDWLIVGGESGPKFRPTDHGWARDLLRKARASGTAFFFKQSAAFRTETGIELDGQIVREFPKECSLATRQRQAGSSTSGACVRSADGNDN